MYRTVVYNRTVHASDSKVIKRLRPIPSVKRLGPVPSTPRTHFESLHTNRGVTRATMENINDIDNDGGEQEAQAEQIARRQHQRQRKQERQRKFKKVNSILKKHGKFPVQNRNSIDELVDRFLEEVEDSVHDLLCNNDVDADNYRGLDSDRDTEAEVETAIRFFPDVLSRRDDRFDEYPIRLLHCLRLHAGADRICNLKAVSFIPIVARLAVEFGLFEEKERGGLLLEEDEGEDNRNTLQLLVRSSHFYTFKNTDTEHNEIVDDKYLQVLIHLRKLGLFIKEDIQRYELLNRLCNEDHFAKKRFHFLSQWDPNALTHPVSLHLHFFVHNPNSSIQIFKATFKAGMFFFPKKKGIHLLFQKDTIGRTPYKIACASYDQLFQKNTFHTPFYGSYASYGVHYASKSKGRDAVMEVIESTLSNCSDKPDNFVDAFLSAAVEKSLSLDCVYFLLRRDPDMLHKLRLDSTLD